MTPEQPTYHYFGGLLAELQRQGLRLGPDAYIQAQKLLMRYAQQPGYTPTERLRAQLGALLATSEKELRLFEEIFDAAYAAGKLPAEIDCPWAQPAGRIDPRGIERFPPR